MAKRVGGRQPGVDIAGVLFDLDGTLVDSAVDLMDSLNELLRSEGLCAVQLVETKAMIGDGVLKLIERALARVGGEPARAPELLGKFLAIYEPRATANTRVYPEVPETLGWLHGRLKIGLVTNKPTRAAHAILADLGLAPFFDVVIGGDTLACRKPRPEPLLAALDRLGVEAVRAVMVGDNHHDVEAARAAGARAIVVAYGYSHTSPDLLGADFTIERMSELPAVLEALQG